MPFQDIIGHSIPISWLRQTIQSNHVAHAYLFVGDDAIGKRMTAHQFIQALNCEAETASNIPDACGQCRACKQIETNIHPDVLIIQPDDSQAQHPQIKIERVREIEHHVIYRPLFGSKKICLIDDADCLTSNAANALLKTLEEPPDHCLFILITSNPSSLLATIKSRCFQVRFSPPAPEQTSHYLIQQHGFTESNARFISFITNGRLGEALSIDLMDAKATQKEFFSLLFDKSEQSMTSRFAAAETLAKSGQTPEILKWFWLGLRDLLLVATESPPEYVLHDDHLTKLQELSRQVALPRLLALLDHLYHLEQGFQRNANIQLGFEEFFIRLHETILPPSGQQS